MDARQVAVGVGSVTLVVLGLGTAVLVGEGSFAPAPHDKPKVVATVRPEQPQPAYPTAPPEVADPMPAAPLTSPVPTEPPPETELTPPPSPQAPPLVEQATPSDEPAPPPAGSASPRVERTPAPVEPTSPPGEPAPSPVLRTPPRAMHGRHRMARVEPPAEELPPPVEQAQPPVEPAPAPPKPRPPVVDHRYDGVLTVAEIGRLKRELRLSPDQAPYWPQLASLLREVGRRQMAQVDAGQRPTFDLPGDLSSRLYSAAMPLLGTLREDQKEVVRRRAQSLGLGSVASFI